MAKTAKKPRAKTRTKQQRSPDKYLRSSIAIVEGVGKHKEKTWPFNYSAAVNQFHSWCFAAASMNAKAVASNPLRLYVRAAKGGRKLLWPTRRVKGKRAEYLRGSRGPSLGPVTRKSMNYLGDDFNEVLDHPILDLLHKVNEFENGYGFSMLRMLYVQLTGNYYIHPVVGPVGVPEQLWTMPAQWTWVIPDRQEFIRGYVYGQTAKLAELEFDPDEIWHAKMPNPRSLFYGLGFVESCWRHLKVSDAKADMDLATFDNMGRPDYLISVKGGASEDALTRYEDKVAAKLRGTKNSGKHLAVSGDVTVTPLNWAPKDLGDAAQVVEVIASVFGVPVAKLKANQNIAGGQAGVSDAAYLKDTVHPLCVMDAELLNAKLIKAFDLEGEAVLCYDNPVPEDEAALVEKAVKYVTGGIWTAAHVNELEGDEPEEGADVLRFNGVPLTMMGQTTAGVAPLPGSGVGTAGTAADPNATAATPPVDPSTPVHAPAADQSAAVSTNDLRQTVGGSAQVLAVQESYYSGTIPQSAAIANLTTVFGFTITEAQGLCKPEAPDAPQSDQQIAQQEAELAAMQQPKPAPGKPIPPGKSFDYTVTNAGTQGHDCGHHHDKGRSGRGAAGQSAPVGTGDNTTQGGSGSPGDGAGIADESDCAMHVHSEFVAKCITKALDKNPTHDGLPESGKVPNFKAELSDVLRNQAEAVIGAVAQSGVDTVLAHAINIVRQPKWIEELHKAVRPFIQDGVQIGGEQALADLGEKLPEGVGFDVINPQVQKYVNRATTELVTGVNSTTEVQVREILGDGLQNGETIPQLTSRVKTWATDNGLTDTTSRSEMIARTESAKAYEAGRVEGWVQSGVVSGKKWLLAPDACEFCEAAAAEFQAKSIGLRQAFFAKGATLKGVDGGTMQLDYSDIMAPPLHPQCRCGLVAEIAHS